MRKKTSIIISLLILMSSLVGISHADGQAIFGGGAHFSWIIFNDIKPDLEQISGRKITLFGMDSMLGQGCNAGIKNALLNSPTHETFGFVCCPLSKEEIDKEGLIVYPLAKEPILILVHDDNPVTNLTSKQARSIFSGNIVNWKEVGGPDKPIVVVTRLHCKNRPGHWKTILPDKSLFRQQRLNVKSAAAMVQRVSDFSGAIGHTGSTWKFDKEDHVKWVSIDGHAPTAENLGNGSYPFYRVLSAVTNRSPSKSVLKLIKEAQTGPAFRDVAKKYSLLPLNPVRQVTAQK